MLLGDSGDFLLVATPGAGKTRFALEAAARLMKRDEISQVIVVTPTAHLRKQWSAAASALGLSLDCEVSNRSTSIPAGAAGAVITFSMAAGAPLAWRHITQQAPTLVVLDEVHHCGDKQAWGPAIYAAFCAAARRFLLSGTPFRSDGTAIPFVVYGPDGRCAPAFEYGYGPALADGIVRPVEFRALEGDMTWRAASQLIRGRLSDAAGRDSASGALAAAYDSDGS